MEAGENQVFWETRGGNQVLFLSGEPAQSSPGFHSRQLIVVARFKKEGKPRKQEVPSQFKTIL